MAPQEFRYIMTVQMTIRGATKKDLVRDGVVKLLQDAKTAGNVEEATWAVTGEVQPEGGKI